MSTRSRQIRDQRQAKAVRRWTANEKAVRGSRPRDGIAKQDERRLECDRPLGVQTT